MTIERSQFNTREEPPERFTYESLTPKEEEIMRLYANPYLEKLDIANQLYISINTLNWHLANIYSKLHETDRFPVVIRFLQLYPDHRPVLYQHIA